MRISDWSSDVCSSDLPMTLSFPDLAPDGRIVLLTGAGISKESGLDTFRDPDGVWARHRIEDVATRSEEHTSELQSLMRISYAVFCWKKKNIDTVKLSHKTNSTNTTLTTLHTQAMSINEPSQ